MRILLVEDDDILAAMLVNALTAEHYAVDVANDGQIGWEFAATLDYDLILLDVMLPRLDGISLCRRLRSQGNQTPILLLTAQDTSTSKVVGLDAGADDYMTKPFDQQELLARIRALQRRESTTLQPVLNWEALTLDPSTREVTYNGEQIYLRPREYDLLDLLLRNPHRVFSRSAILDHLWSLEEPPGEETVTAHIKGLRQHLRAAGIPHDPIETVYGIGYRLKPETPEEKGMTPQAAEQANLKASAVWARTQQRLTQRLAILEQAATAVQSETLTDDLRQQAEQAAHKLAGSLGMFNFDAGSQLAHDAEVILQNWSGRNPDQRHRLTDLVQVLQQSIQYAIHHQTPTLFYAQSSPPASTPSPHSLTASPHPIAQLLPPDQPTLGMTAEGATVLVMDDDPSLLDAVSALLTPWGLKVFTLKDPQQFWETLQITQPDLLILDVEMPDQNGLELCHALRRNAHWEPLPVLFLTAHRDAEIQHQVFAAGADDFVAKPVVGPELITRIFNRLERSRLSRRYRQVDTLTGVTNRPYATQVIEQYLTNPATQSLCLATLRVNALAEINRHYGYQAGDTVLARLGQLLQRSFTDQAMVARWGGRLFVVAMPEISLQQAVHCLNKLLTDFRQLRVEGNRQQPVSPLSFSAGVVTYPQAGANWSTLLDAALSVLGQARPGCILST